MLQLYRTLNERRNEKQKNEIKVDPHLLHHMMSNILKGERFFSGSRQNLRYAIAFKANDFLQFTSNDQQHLKLNLMQCKEN